MRCGVQAHARTTCTFKFAALQAALEPAVKPAVKLPSPDEMQLVPGTNWALVFDDDGEMEYLDTRTGKIVGKMPPEVVCKSTNRSTHTSVRHPSSSLHFTQFFIESVELHSFRKPRVRALHD